MRREALAARAGVSYGYIRQLESDDPPTPGLNVARRIADVLGVAVDEAFPPLASEAVRS